MVGTRVNLTGRGGSGGSGGGVRGGGRGVTGGKRERLLAWEDDRESTT